MPKLQGNYRMTVIPYRKKNNVQCSMYNMVTCYKYTVKAIDYD